MTLYRVRIVLLAPSRDDDVRSEATQLMAGLLAAASQEPAIEDVAAGSDRDDATVTVEATVAAASRRAAVVELGAVVCLLTAYPVVATEDRVI